MGMFGKKRSSEPFEFRVSDSVEVPLRGYLLRLKVTNGEPALGDLSPGSRIRLRSPSGAERVVTIKDRSVTIGKASQERLDRTREFDVVIDGPDAIVNGELVEIGWTASGPAESN
jgi:hypothetical protein